MKKTVYYLGVLLLFIYACQSDDDTSNAPNSPIINPENIYKGDLYLNSQEALIDFYTKNNYLRIDGNVFIAGIHDISPFKDVVEITGNLSISYTKENALLDTPDLKTISPIALEKIGGSLSISKAEALTNISGLSQLQFIGGDLSLNNNGQLSSLNGLTSLTEIGGSLIIANHPSFIQWKGLNLLQKIGGSVHIRSNNNLSDLEGLQQLTSIAKDLSITSNTSLYNFCALQNTTIQGNIIINGNGYNPSKEHLTNDNCKTAGEKVFTGNKFISNQDELEIFAAKQYTKVEGSLIINNVIDMSSLKDLKTITGELRIKNNRSTVYSNGTKKSLKNLRGLENLQTVGAKLTIQYNTFLENVDALENLTSLTNLFIEDNGSLHNLQGFKNLENITEELRIKDLPSLTALTGFDNLRTAGFIRIVSNDILEKINTFELLQKVDNLWILANPELIDVKGFTTLNNVDNRLWIFNNKKLSNHCAFKNTVIHTFQCSKNAYNPTKEMLATNACSP
ncbi:hypothetical protein ACFSTE_20155 [Aquimarina hainanensis]|uniref:Receptor L-domain domain-containing protein n=1 Tax=Aquimarina hainanensis TaxID=1578017 RepID=A0ABW5NF11_9FLAO